MSELEQFVLDYLQDVGSIVEPPAYGVYEVLLPEQIAENWKVPAYLKLAFTETEQKDITQIGYNHPLVEQMVQEAHNRAASTRLYINNLRLDKSGLDDLAMKSWVILNARAERQEKSTVSRVRSTYVRFNFKAAILSDDKQERLVHVLMDAHTGSRVAEADLIESHAKAISSNDVLASLPDAPMRWRPKEGPILKSPLDKDTLTALLTRAQTAVLQEMETELSTLQKRVIRFRQLDQARLTDYYDTLEEDLRARLRRASADRSAGLQEKLEAVQNERLHKLADLAERYRIHINLSLINLLVIQQPKLIQPVRIANRSTQVRSHAVWDPVRHQLEPLHCRVCGQPGQHLYLCINGHLAHADCLAPACVDCKRVFCGDCAHEVSTCDVCHEPLCNYSRLSCPDCGRYTCQKHRDLCHADEGSPVDLTAQTTLLTEPERLVEPESPSATMRGSRTRQPPRKRKRKPKSAPKEKRSPRPLRMEIILHNNAIAAYLLGKRGREIAIRTWELVPEEGGILRNCQCEKGDKCQADGMILRPYLLHEVENQLNNELVAFAKEYRLPLTKMNFNRLSSLNGEPFPVTKFRLFGLWKNEEAINEARDTFSRLYWN